MFPDSLKYGNGKMELLPLNLKKSSKPFFLRLVYTPEVLEPRFSELYYQNSE